jgi:hypothetical protein
MPVKIRKSDLAYNSGLDEAINDKTLSINYAPFARSISKKI